MEGMMRVADDSGDGEIDFFEFVDIITSLVYWYSPYLEGEIDFVEFVDIMVQAQTKEQEESGEVLMAEEEDEYAIPYTELYALLGDPRQDVPDQGGGTHYRAIASDVLTCVLVSWRVWILKNLETSWKNLGTSWKNLETSWKNLELTSPSLAATVLTIFMSCQLSTGPSLDDVILPGMEVLTLTLTLTLCPSLDDVILPGMEVFK